MHRSPKGNKSFYGELRLKFYMEFIWRLGHDIEIDQCIGIEFTE